MTYHGRVRKGVVVFDGELKPPDGTDVRVEPMEDGALEKRGCVYDRLAEIAGKAKNLPPDLARQHDHYLHGQPRR